MVQWSGPLISWALPQVMSQKSLRLEIPNCVTSAQQIDSKNWMQQQNIKKEDQSIDGYWMFFNQYRMLFNQDICGAPLMVGLHLDYWIMDPPWTNKETAKCHMLRQRTSRFLLQNGLSRLQVMVPAWIKELVRHSTKLQPLASFTI